MTEADDNLAKMRAICLALPDTSETPTWGTPHFRVGDKIFAGYGEHEDRASIGFKATKEEQAALIEDERFFVAPYVGRHGWCGMWLDRRFSWKAVAALIHRSYELIAPAPKKRPAATKRQPAAPRKKPAKKA
jgi:predicted DNA-binding protein (MmcQ/YjbR family)